MKRIVVYVPVSPCTSAERITAPVTLPAAPWEVAT